MTTNKKSFAPIIPLVTLLLCSFNHDPIVIHDPIGGSIDFTMGPIDIVLYGDAFQRIVIPPSKKGENTRIFFSYRQDISASRTISVYHISPIGGEDTLVYSKTFNEQSFSDSFLYTELYAKGSYVNTSVNGGPQFRFLVKSGVNTIVNKTCSSCYVSEKGFTNLYNPGANTSSLTIFEYTPEEGDTLQADSFTFSSISNEEYYYDLGPDNSINLSFPLFKYSTYLSDLEYYLNETYAEIYYIDLKNVFPNIANDKVVTFRGSISRKSDGYYHFDPITTFYIDPLTRVLYNDYQEGRILTNQLYFPIGAYELLKEVDPSQNLLLFSNYSGFSKTRITYALKLSLNPNNLVGSCETSEYCVQSSDSTPDFTIGTSKEN